MKPGTKKQITYHRETLENDGSHTEETQRVNTGTI